MKNSWAPRLFIFLLIVTVFFTACSNSNSNGNAAETTTTKPSASPSKSSTEPEPEPAKQVTIEFWHAYGEGEEKVLLDEVIPSFTEKYPNIKINPTRMPTENLKQQVITAVVGGVAPDVMRMDLIWVAEFADQKALLPLDKMFEFDTIKAELFPGPMQTNYYDGQYYGVPLDTNTKVNIYNKAEMNALGTTEPPRTIDEFVELARKAKAAEKTLITIGGTNNWDMLPWFWTLGGRITDDTFQNAEGFFNSEASVKAMETVLSWYDEGLISPPILGGEPGTWEGLEQGKYVSINDGPWFFGIKGEAVKDVMIPAKMPYGPDGESHSIVGGQDMVMFAGAKNPDEAWTFTQFMLSEEIQTLMAVKAGVMPTNMKSAKSEQLQGVYYLPAYVAELETAFARTPSAQWGQIEVLIGDAFEKIIRKASPVKEALDQAAKEIDVLLKQKNL
ncbi:extracellular solute-binding protein [Cohnella sp. WQ 127256]|uniref:extracellular solute-binding protein n=1 Tax=Cohnella sp. WQ 127256 TaxID=2938790 RepID=UPI00211745B6|nr:extracellular solute-binding protein [Cohnella sp. WQ 127256]